MLLLFWFTITRDVSVWQDTTETELTTRIAIKHVKCFLCGDNASRTKVAHSETLIKTAAAASASASTAAEPLYQNNADAKQGRKEEAQSDI